MRPVDEYAYMSPAVRARTILHARCRAEAARLAPGSPGPATPGSAVFPVSVVDDGNVLHVVHRAGLPPAFRLQITCRARIGGLGVLRFVGDAGLPLHPSEVAAAGAFPEYSTREPAVVVPVGADVVRLLVPATATRRAHAVHVDVDAFRNAAHDPWVVAGPHVGPEVERRHQSTLLRLVAPHVPSGQVGSVVVRRIRCDALDVTCLGADGVTDVCLPFPGHVPDTGALESWLDRAAG